MRRKLAPALAVAMALSVPSVANSESSMPPDDFKDARALVAAAISSAAPFVFANEIALNTFAIKRPPVLSIGADQYAGSACQLQATLTSVDYHNFQNADGGQHQDGSAYSSRVPFDLRWIKGVYAQGNDLILRWGETEKESVTIDLGIVDPDIIEAFGFKNIAELREAFVDALFLITQDCGQEA